MVVRRRVQNDAPTVGVDAFDDAAVVDAVVARASASMDVVAAEGGVDDWSLCQGAWTIEDEADFVTVAVEVTGDVALFLSVEEGCRRDVCGALRWQWDKGGNRFPCGRVHLMR